MVTAAELVRTRTRTRRRRDDEQAPPASIRDWQPPPTVTAAPVPCPYAGSQLQPTLVAYLAQPSSRHIYRPPCESSLMLSATHCRLLPHKARRPPRLLSRPAASGVRHLVASSLSSSSFR